MPIEGIGLLWAGFSLTAGYWVSELYREHCHPSGHRGSRSWHGAFEFNLMFWGLEFLFFGWVMRKDGEAILAFLISTSLLGVTARRFIVNWKRNGLEP